MARKRVGRRARWGQGQAHTTPPRPGLGNPRAFTPFQAPTRPPPGFYDPSLDADERASGRGLGDLAEDVDRANLESRNDLNFGLERIGTSRTRGAEDYGRSVEELNRQYGNLATRQAETARASGNRGGALAQALRKRAGNQAFDRAPIDTNFGRLNQDLDVQQGRLGVEFQRGWDERNLVALPRAQRENAEFGLDTNAQRWFQSRQAGYEPPTKPANERTVGGLTVRVGGQRKPLAQRMYTLPSGQQLSRRGFVNTVRRRRGQPVGG
jgi:hypothetical protein